MTTPICAVSPGARKRGSDTIVTTGSRTVTLPLAAPSSLAEYATAISRTRPWKSGTSQELVADLDGAARPRDIEPGERYRKGARARIDAEPGDADRPTRPARHRGTRPRWRHVLRAIGADQRVDPTAPSGIDRDLKRRAVERQLDRAQRQDAVGGDRQLGFAGERRLDEHLCGIARLVARLV